MNMGSVMRLLFRILIREFYAINAGYFLFFFIFFFGVVSPNDLVFYHVSLILGMFNSAAFMVVVMLLWFFYNLKCLFFCSKTLNRPENIFLTNLQVFSFKKQFVLFLINHFLLYLPVLVYSGFVVGMAFKHGHTALALILIGYQLFNCVIGALACYYNISNTWKQNKRGLAYLVSKMNTRRKISYPFYLISYTAFHRKITFFSLKLFSLFMLYVLFVLNRDDFSFINFIMIFLILIMAHAVMPFYYISFLEKKMAFSRNLPVPLLKTGVLYFITYCVLFLPELLFLLINALHYLSLIDVLLLYTIAVVNLLLFTAILYMEDIHMKKYFKIIFVIFFVSTFILNLKARVFLIGADLLIASIVFINSYHRYESKQA